MLETLTNPAFAPIVGATMTIAFGIVSLYFRWLNKNFSQMNASLKNLSENTSRWLEAHEDLDQVRHEQNLHRFEKISVALARLGSDNGLYEKKEI